ncbi:hypothetical protein QGN23_14060 [Chryseobacterium gotjawalense]|uniref:Uncharacterized protein n=1 Tax=Chryseobacterium gotjawalense TaxID=3042315 RepID=A0ABY8RCH6_9FLAO|nr:hypothetical protein [Chryseobacterium sp. wdc7]WHF51531.1 hypothetical protein QGN23_14060 [Chryseobacterium sp. wdc7]
MKKILHKHFLPSMAIGSLLLEQMGKCGKFRSSSFQIAEKNQIKEKPKHGAKFRNDGQPACKMGKQDGVAL